MCQFFSMSHDNSNCEIYQDITVDKNKYPSFDIDFCYRVVWSETENRIFLPSVVNFLWNLWNYFVNLNHSWAESSVGCQLSELWPIIRLSAQHGWRYFKQNINKLKVVKHTYRATYKAILSHQLHSNLNSSYILMRFMTYPLTFLTWYRHLSKNWLG